MKKNEKYVPIHLRIFRAMALPFLLAAFVLLALLFLDHLFLKKVDQIFDMQEYQTEYYRSASAVDLTLQDYLEEQTEENRDICMAESRELLHWASCIAEGIQGQEGANYYNMAKTYTDAVEQVIACAGTLSAEEVLARYQEASVWKTVLEANQYSMEKLLTQERDRMRQNIVANLRVQYLVILGVFSVLLIISFGICWKETRSIAQPLQLLAAYAKTVQDPGSIQDLEEISCRNDETGILYDSFQRMIRIIREQFYLYQEKKELELKLKQSEMEQLRTQNQMQNYQLRLLHSRLNPHFLFNAMNVAISLGYEEEAPETVEALSVFARYLRYSLDKQDAPVSLMEEIVNLEDYLTLQKKRFPGRFRSEILIAEECRLCHVPAMILQPLAENSFQHGFDHGRVAGTLSVKATCGGGRVHLSVSDDGCGMTLQRREEIEARLHGAQAYEDQEGIGLHNVYQRMKIFFDGEVHFALLGNEGTGTMVQMDFPMRRKGEAEGGEACRNRSLYGL